LGAQRAGAAETRGAAMTLPIAAEYAALAAADDAYEAAEAPATPRLSAREQELVMLVAQGRTDAQTPASSTSASAQSALTWTGSGTRQAAGDVRT